MPIVRADVPEWLTADQKTKIRSALHACIARTWAREHIWVAVRPMSAAPNERTVILTVDLREGRGGEKERTEALFDEALAVLQDVVGTKGSELILLVRQFAQNECISGGGPLPPLSDITPPIDEVRKRRRRVA